MDILNDKRRRIELTEGERHYRFVVGKRASHQIQPSGRTETSWHCLCDCGAEFVCSTKQIQKGTRRSCGCMSRKGGRFDPMDDKEAVIQTRYTRHLQNSRRRDIESALTLSQFADLVSSPCYYCGEPPTRMVKTNNHLAPVNGIDRQNSHLGYVMSNCVPCCLRCNGAKGELTTDQFYAWIQRLTNYDKSQPK